MIYTNSKMPEHVGNKLACTSCHAQGGNGNALSLEGVSKNTHNTETVKVEMFHLKSELMGVLLGV